MAITEVAAYVAPAKKQRSFLFGVGMASPVGFDSVLDSSRLGGFRLGVIVSCALVR